MNRKNAKNIKILKQQITSAYFRVSDVRSLERRAYKLSYKHLWLWYFFLGHPVVAHVLNTLCDLNIYSLFKLELKNVWMSDKSWEPRMHECLKVLNNFCFHVYAQNLLSHFLTLTLSHSHSFSLSHSFNLSFNHSRHAEQVLFSSLCSKVAVVGENCNGHFWTSSSAAAAPSPVSLDVIELVPS